jgi:hypothetical protein
VRFTYLKAAACGQSAVARKRVVRPWRVLPVLLLQRESVSGNVAR